jgi:hypothetical protein
MKASVVQHAINNVPGNGYLPAKGYEKLSVESWSAAMVLKVSHKKRRRRFNQASDCFCIMTDKSKTRQTF